MTSHSTETAEKLARIKARCLELLALAEKRTPAPWFVTKQGGVASDVIGEGWRVISGPTQNAAFIAACAGAAEAGWRTTIAAIEHVQRNLKMSSYKPERATLIELHDAILAAWQEELL